MRKKEKRPGFKAGHYSWKKTKDTTGLFLLWHLFENISLLSQYEGPILSALGTETTGASFLYDPQCRHNWPVVLRYSKLACSNPRARGVSQCLLFFIIKKTKKRCYSSEKNNIGRSEIQFLFSQSVNRGLPTKAKQRFGSIFFHCRDRPCS